jgi:hypothetical protein
MSNERDFLYCPDKPPIFGAQEVAWYLKINVDRIGVLIKNGFLFPLGNPRQSAPKFFLKADLDVLVKNRETMNALFDCLKKYWKEKNNRKTANTAKLKSISPSTTR